MCTAQRRKMKRVINFALVFFLNVPFLYAENKKSDNSIKKNNVRLEKKEPVETIYLKDLEVSIHWPEVIKFNEYDTNVYVVDIMANRIITFDAYLKFLDILASSEGTLGELSMPKDISFYDGRFAVLDRGNSRVQIFDKDFNALSQFVNYSDHMAVNSRGQCILCKIRDMHSDHPTIFTIKDLYGEVVTNFGDPVIDYQQVKEIATHKLGQKREKEFLVLH